MNKQKHNVVVDKKRYKLYHEITISYIVEEYVFSVYLTVLNCRGYQHQYL